MNDKQLMALQSDIPAAGLSFIDELAGILKDAPPELFETNVQNIGFILGLLSKHAGGSENAQEATVTAFVSLLRERCLAQKN